MNLKSSKYLNMKTGNSNKEEKYVAPEVEALQITLGTVLNTSCSTNQFEPIDCNPNEEICGFE